MPTPHVLRLATGLIVATSVFLPAPGQAQPSPAGVVTNLQGQAVVARPVVATPVPLRLRDDIFVRDRIETRENALVRVLLGGKAVVTIRELSVFTVTEEPGRATVDLSSGRLALGVAKARLAPGEVIEIRTPNAIAGVRGSLVVADARSGGGSVESRITVLEVSAPVTVCTAARTDCRSMAPKQAVTVSGLGTAAKVGNVEEISPEEARAAAQTASAPTALDTAPLAADIGRASLAEATRLATLLAPGGGSPLQASPSPLPADSWPLDTGAGEVASTSTIGVQDAIIGDPGIADLVGGGAPPPAPPGGPPPPGGIVPVSISGQTITLQPTETLLTLSGTLVQADASTVVTIADSTVSGAQTLLRVAAGSDVTLLGSLLGVTGQSQLVADASLVDIKGTLRSQTTGALLGLDPTVVSAMDFVRIGAGGAVTLAGPLLADALGIYQAARDLVGVVDGGRLTGPGGGAALIDLDGTFALAGTAEIGGAVLGVRGAGSLVDLSGAAARLVNGSALLAGGTALLEVSAGGTLLGRGAGALLEATGGGLLVTEGARGALVDGATLTLAGGLMRADGDAVVVTTSAAPFVDLVHAQASVGGPLLRLEGDSVFGSSTGPAALAPLPAALVHLDGATFTATTPDGEAAVLHVDATTATGEGGAAAFLAGPLLVAVNGSRIETSGPLFAALAGGTAEVADVDAPFVSLSGGVHAIATDEAAAVIHLSGRSISGPEARDGLALGTDEPLRPGLGPLVQISDGARVSSQSLLHIDAALLQATAPLLDLVGDSALTTYRHAVDLSGGARVVLLGASDLVRLDASRLDVTGSLVRVQGSELTVGGDLVRMAHGSTLTISGGALLTVTGGAVVSISGSLVSFGGAGSLISVDNPYVPTGFLYGVPVYSSLGGTTGFTVTSPAPLKGLGTAGEIWIRGQQLQVGATGGVTGSLVVILDGQVHIGPRVGQQ